MSRRLSKASKKRLIVFGSLSMLFIISFVFRLIYNVYLICDKTIEKTKLENEYVELQEKTETLKKNIDKLNDPDYLANYAREEYLYSTDKDYIIQFEELEEVETKIETIDSLNKSYLITAICILLFIYIVFKIRRHKK